MSEFSIYFLVNSLLVASLTLLIVGLSIAYWKLFAETKKIEKKTEDSREKNHEAARQIILDANEIANKKIKDATLKAEELITLGENLQKGIAQKLDEATLRAQSEYADLFEKFLEDSKDEFARTIATLPSAIEGKIAKEVEIAAGQEKVRIEEELNEYKKVRMAKIDEQVLATVKDASMNVLNKSFSPSDHLDIIKFAVEGAKKQNGA